MKVYKISVTWKNKKYREFYIDGVFLAWHEWKLLYPKSRVLRFSIALTNLTELPPF